MSDKTMEDIKSGKGLPPLSNNSGSGNQSGVTTEQRGLDINHETFTRQGNEKTNNYKEND